MAQSKQATRQYGLFCMGGGRGQTLKDSDLWGLMCALQHGIQDGYFKENQEWAETMVKKLTDLREG